MPDLPPVTQDFELNAADFLAGISEMIAETDRLADDLDKVRNKALEADAALGHLRDDAVAASLAENGLGDSADKAGEKLAAAGEADTKAMADAEAGTRRVGNEVDDLAKKAEQNSSSGGMLGKFLFGKDGNGNGLSNAVSKIGDIFSKIPGVGTKIPGLGNLPYVGSVAENPYGLAALAAGGQALLVELTGVVSGFAAAGAGAGAFALLAKPAVTSVMTAYTGLNTAVTAYQAAQAKEAMSPSKANAAAMQAALLNVNLAGQAIQKLPVSEQKAVDGLERLSTSFHNISKAFEPTAFKVFDDALTIANNLLPTITPWATTFANALDGLLKQAARFTESKGFKDWLAQFHTLEGPSVTAIGEGIGKVAVAIGKLLTIMSAKDVVNSINILFTTLAGIITGVGLAVRFAMFQWDMLTKAFDSGRTAVKAAGHDIASGFATARHAAATAAHDVAHAFDGARHDIAAAFDAIRHTVTSAVDAVVSYVRGHWKLLVAIILGPLGLIIDAMATHWAAVKHGFQAAWSFVSGVVKNAASGISAILSPFAKWITSLFSATWSLVSGIFQWAWSLLTSTSSSGVGLIKGSLHWFAGLASLFSGWWSAAVSTVSRWINNMISYVEGIPGRINSALSGLPGMLFNAGVNAINGLINGILSGVGALGSTMSGIASKVAGFFGLSPAKEGPLSGSGSPKIRGQHFAADIAAGILDGQPLIAAAMHRAAGSAGLLPGGAGSLAIPGGGAGGGAGGTPIGDIHLTVNGFVGNQQELMQALYYQFQAIVLQQNRRNVTNGLTLRHP